MADIALFLISVLPGDEQSLEMLHRLMGGGIITIITICLIAPFLEEMFFRGILLRGFLGHYSPLNAILLSSLLFAAAHLNFYQVPTAFVIGCFFGWLFYLCQSVWPCIIGHAANNFGAYLFYVSGAEEGYNHLLISVSTFLVSAAGVYLIYKLFYRPDHEKPDEST